VRLLGGFGGLDETVTAERGELLFERVDAVGQLRAFDVGVHGLVVELGSLALVDGRLRTNIGQIADLDDAVAAFNPTKPVKGKTIIRVRP